MGEIHCLIRAGHIHGCNLACGNEGSIESERTSGLKRDVGILRRRKAVGAYIDTIIAGEQVRDGISTIGIGRTGAAGFLRSTHDQDSCTLNKGTLGVLDDTGDGCSGSLSLDDCGD